MTLFEYCNEKNQMALLREWDCKNNMDITPDNLLAYSHVLVWWRCEKGHLWQCSLKDRTGKGSGCPYCAGKLPIIGETDLLSTHPNLAAEWHPNKNGDLKPEHVTAGSDRKVWWECSLGHEWQATLENRAFKGTGCPYCSGKRAWEGFNDLATLYPELMQEWYYEYNKNINPRKIRPGARKRVFWKCAYGHVWDTWLFNRTSKQASGCPYCAGNAKKGRGECAFTKA